MQLLAPTEKRADTQATFMQLHEMLKRNADHAAAQAVLDLLRQKGKLP
jgi:lipid-A-disaccharide synthase